MTDVVLDVVSPASITLDLITTEGVTTEIVVPSAPTLEVVSSRGPIGPTGPQGIQGETGQGFTWRGNWGSSTDYVAYDTVRDTLAGDPLDRGTYVCILATNPGDINQPPYLDSEHWEILAADGDTGATGGQGDDGPNNITTATTTNLNGILVGDGDNVSSVTLGTAASRDVGTGEGNVPQFGDGEITFPCQVTFQSSTLHKFTDGQFIFADDSGILYWFTGANGLQVWNADFTTLLLTIANDGTVTFVGSVSASNLSGTNTGDQDLSGYAPLATPFRDAFSGTGSQTAFTLTHSPSLHQLTLVFIDNVLQVPTTDYSFSGTALTFTTAPYSGASIDIRYCY